jgi:amino acid permease
MTSSLSLSIHHTGVESVVDDKLVLWQGIALLTADCMGVGVLALPNDIRVLGWLVGIGFLVANLPINYYAGNLLAELALDIEEKCDGGMMGPHNIHDRRVIEQVPAQEDHLDADADVTRRSNRRRQKKHHATNSDIPIVIDDNGEDDLEDIDNSDTSTGIQLTERSIKASSNTRKIADGIFRQDFSTATSSGPIVFSNVEGHTSHNNDNKNNNNNIFDDSTTDLINISQVVFTPKAVATYMVKSFYYTNLFLVLGDYIIVMARSISAVFSDEICLPVAGMIASTLMFGLCQFRSMASLGRSVSLASLLALFVVIIQCIIHHRSAFSPTSLSGVKDGQRQQDDFEDDGIWGKFSSLAGIGFAVGSQKLFLNIRHELRHREESSKVLAGSLACYGLAYVVVIILAGPDPPSFLFDSIPEGWSRRIAGLLLWFHVAVSYAINSQALCGSLDRYITSSASNHYRFMGCGINPAKRWLLLTLVVTVSSFLVANAIPFFKDLVGLVSLFLRVLWQHRCVLIPILDDST